MTRRRNSLLVEENLTAGRPSQLHQATGFTQRNAEPTQQAPDPAESQPKFQFITESGLSRPKGTSLALIRSTARRKQPKKKRDVQLRYRSLRPATISDTDRGLGHETDPFRLIQIPVNKPYTSMISQRYSNLYDAVLRYSNIRPDCSVTETLDRELSDPAILHMAIASYVQADSLSCPKNIYHMNQALKIVNRRIANSHQKAITNDTILTIVTIAAFEFRSGSTVRVKLHLDGVEAVIRSAGGFEALSSDRYLTRNLYAMDIVTAIFTGLRPRFKIARERFQPDLAAMLAARHKSELLNFTGSFALNQEILEVYAILRQLIMETEKAIATQNFTEAEFESFALYSQYLSYRLISLAQYKNSTSRTPDRNIEIVRLLGFAGLAHILLFTSKLPRMGARMRTFLSTQLRVHLETIDIGSCQMAYPQMMLWIILIGGLSSEGTADQDWFTKTLANACCSAGIVGTRDLPVFLSEFLWSDFYMVPAFEDFWAAVARAQTANFQNVDVNN